METRDITKLWDTKYELPDVVLSNAQAFLEKFNLSWDISLSHLGFLFIAHNLIYYLEVQVKEGYSFRLYRKCAFKRNMQELSWGHSINCKNFNLVKELIPQYFDMAWHEYLTKRYGVD